MLEEPHSNERPGPICPSDLLLDLDSGPYLKGLTASSRSKQNQLKPNLQEGVHFVKIDQIVWDFLLQKNKAT